MKPNRFHQLARTTRTTQHTPSHSTLPSTPNGHNVLNARTTTETGEGHDDGLAALDVVAALLLSGENGEGEEDHGTTYNVEDEVQPQEVEPRRRFLLVALGGVGGWWVAGGGYLYK